MISRDDVLSSAVNLCMKELYSLVTPSVEWDDFIRQNKIYSERYKTWERYKHLSNKENKSEEELHEYEVFSKKWDGKSITECIGPRPFEFYYLPRRIFKDICDSYIYAYRLDGKQELLDTITILKGYCNEPVVDKYIKDYTDENGNYHPGHRDYEHPDNLEKEIQKVISRSYAEINEIDLASECIDKFFEFLDMAGNFFNWTRDLHSFCTNIYLGVSPYSNKEKVIDNWKKYRDKDIEINEEQIIKDYYGDED